VWCGTAARAVAERNHPHRDEDRAITRRSGNASAAAPNTRASAKQPTHEALDFFRLHVEVHNHRRMVAACRYAFLV
jgi:hypothetical protein